MAARESTIKVMRHIAAAVHIFNTQPGILEKHQQDIQEAGGIAWGRLSQGTYRHLSNFLLAHALETAMAFEDWDFFAQARIR